MISAFTDTWKIPELRDRILFTMAMIVIVRLGVHLPLPGVNMDVIREYLDILKEDNEDGAGGGVGAILNVFSGGGLTSMGLFALGIMPYISASIMMQLLPQRRFLTDEPGAIWLHGTFKHLTHTVSQSL